MLEVSFMIANALSTKTKEFPSMLGDSLSPPKFLFLTWLYIKLSTVDNIAEVGDAMKNII